MNKKWYKRYLELAKFKANWSKDPSTKTGAVIVGPNNLEVSSGYNGFPKGVRDNTEYYSDRHTKYERILHSEVNAILAAKRDLTGCTIYCYPLMPCARCAAQIIQAGITTVVFPYSQDSAVTDRFRVSHEHALDMFEDAGVTLILYEGDLDGD